MNINARTNAKCTRGLDTLVMSVKLRYNSGKIEENIFVNGEGLLKQKLGFRTL